MLWVRLTHAISGGPVDINLHKALGVFRAPGSEVTEILSAPGVIYNVAERPDEIWAGTKIALVQVAPVVKLTKTQARRRK